MELYYRAMGFVARWSERASHIRGNGIPLNWLLMVVLLILVVASGEARHESLVNGTRPRDATLSEVMEHRDPTHNYISTSGILVPQASIAFEERELFGLVK